MQVVTAPLWWVVLRFIGSLLGIALGIFIILAIVNIILAFAADPGICDAAGRTINISDANADAFQSKWDQFDDDLETQATSVSFNESEITSRADRYLEETGSPVKHVVICIRAGYGEASGSLETPIGLDADIKIRGTMDLTGAHPKAKIDDIDIGGIPDFLIGPVEGWLEDLIDDQLNKIDLKHRYEPVLTEGNAEIKGTP